MYTWQPHTLCWSFSKRHEFEWCRRAYFYDRFWGQDPKTSYRIYTLRMLTTIPAMRGEVVHTVIAEALRSARAGQAMSVEAAKERVTDLLRKRWIESARRDWHKDNRPPGRKMSEFTSLFEHYYEVPDALQQVRDARRVALSCIENLMESPFWAELVESDPSGWIELEESEFHSFDLDGIMVYARIDFAHTNGAPTIIDWKTGDRTQQDREQLLVYALYARSRWGWDPAQARLSAVYLYPEIAVDSFTPALDDIRTAEEAIKTSFNEMVKLEPVYGPANIENFPPTENAARCGWCRFRELCSDIWG